MSAELHGEYENMVSKVKIFHHLVSDDSILNIVVVKFKIAPSPYHGV